MEITQLIEALSTAIVLLVLSGILALAGKHALRQIVAFLLTVYSFIRAAFDDKGDLAIRLIVKYLDITPEDAIKYADVALDAFEAALKAEADATAQESMPQGG